MSKVNTFENEIMKLIFHNVGIPNLGDTTGILPSASNGRLYIALYSVSPTDSTNGTEANYTNYARVIVAREVTKWTVSGTSPTRAENIDAIIFPTSSSAETIVGVGICFEPAGVPKYFNTFTSQLSIINGSIPTIQIGQLKINED